MRKPLPYGLSELRNPQPSASKNDKPGKAMRTLGLVLLFIGLKAFGNLSLAWGTKHFAERLSSNPLPYLAAMANPFVTAGIAMLILSLFTRMALLSVADLSFVLPVTSIGYVLSTLLGATFLGEKVTYTAWTGTLLIFAGAAVVSSTPRVAVENEDDAR